jgi:glutaredoxin-like protein
MSQFTMYSTPWCGYCRRLKGILNRDGITFDEVDIEADPASADLVMSLNDGNATVPTLVFADGSSLTNPHPNEVKAKIAELADRAQREHADYTFTKNGRPAVVMMSVAQYESLMETLSILSDPEARADLVESADSEEFTTEEEMAELMRERLNRDSAA